jgi:hypothetical protein
MNHNLDVNFDYSVKKFFYNNAVFVSQLLISLFGLGFSAGMLITGKDAATYLPIMTSIIGVWIPSPLNHKLEQPSGIPQIRDILQRSANNV